jgi:hypothetical protein
LKTILLLIKDPYRYKKLPKLDVEYHCIIGKRILLE